MARTLQHHPPRRYSLDDARRRRPWRSAVGKAGVESLVIGGAITALGMASGPHPGLIGLGAVLILAGLLCWPLGVVRSYGTWVRLVRSGQAVQGRLGHHRPITLIHELMKPARDRTCVLHYHYTDAEGTSHEGKVWVCSCVIDRLPPHDEVTVLIDPANPKISVPMRLATMVARH